jgi:hypothetical protein
MQGFKTCPSMRPSSEHLESEDQLHQRKILQESTWGLGGRKANPERIQHSLEGSHGVPRQTKPGVTPAGAGEQAQ